MNQCARGYRFTFAAAAIMIVAVYRPAYACPLGTHEVTSSPSPGVVVTDCVDDFQLSEGRAGTSIGPGVVKQFSKLVPYRWPWGEWPDGRGRIGLRWFAEGPDPSFSRLGGPPVTVNLSGYDLASGRYSGFDVSGTRNSGYRVTDTAGTIAPGSVAPGFHSLEWGGRVNITADGGRLLDLNASHQLLLGLDGAYHHNSMDFGSSVLTPGVINAGSVRRNTYTFAGSASYAVNTLYLTGHAAADWSHADITNNINTPGAEGETKGRGYDLRVTVGNIFPLFGTLGGQPATFAKGPRNGIGSYAVFLDVSGHYGHRRDRDDSFTDNIGFVYGEEQLSYNYLGARARLEAIVPSYGYAWMPFVGVTIDRQVGFSHTLDIPAQGRTTADTFIFDESKTFWGVEGGLETLYRGSARFGAKAFYQSSSDTHTTGGSLFVKIPLWEPIAADSGIRIARSK